MSPRTNPWGYDPPEDLDALVSWLDEFGRHLVLLEEASLPVVQSAMTVTRERVLVHLRSSEIEARPDGATPRADELVEIVRLDHRWFETSLEEWAGLLRIVEGEDQGGHRQALGQYSRLLATSLARHRRDERELERLRLTDGARPLRNPN